MLIDGFCGTGVMVQSGHCGFGGQVVHGVGSLDSSVTFGPLGGVPVAIAKL